MQKFDYSFMDNADTEDYGPSPKEGIGSAGKDLSLPDPMDPAPLIGLFADYKAKIEEMWTEAKALEVKDDASSARCAEMAAQSQQLNNAIEKARKAALEPYQQVVKALNDDLRPVKDNLTGIKCHLESKNRPYLIQKEKERQEAERKAHEAQLAAQRAREEAERKAAEAEAKGEEPPPSIVPEVLPDVTPDKTRIKTASGGSQGIEYEWAWELLNLIELPEHILNWKSKPSAKTCYEKILEAIGPAINAQIKAGVRNLAGVRIFEQPVVKTRAGR